MTATHEIEIAGRKIGIGHPPYVVCELSANHNGSLERALQLIEAAAATGADDENSDLHAGHDDD